jgi:hypothetical protein
MRVTATGSGGRQESRVVRATPAKIETEVRVSCGGALSEVGCCGSECSQQTRLASPHSLSGKTWCHIPSRRLLTIQSHFSLVVIVTTIRIQLADSFRRRLPLTTTVRFSTASTLTFTFADNSTGKMVILVVRLRFLPGVKVLKQRLGEGAPVERIVTNTFRRVGKDLRALGGASKRAVERQMDDIR